MVILNLHITLDQDNRSNFKKTKMTNLKSVRYNGQFCERNSDKTKLLFDQNCLVNRERPIIETQLREVVL